MNKLFDEGLAVLDSESLRIYLVLVRMARSKSSRASSYEELGQHCGLTADLAEGAIKRLAAQGFINFSKNKLTLDSDGYIFTLRIEKKVEDTAEDLVRENATLRRRIEELENQEQSGLADKVSAESGQVIRLAENILMRGLTHEEVFYLSDILARYGPKRVVASLNTTRNSKSPLRATYMRLVRGALGNPMKQKESPLEVASVWEPPDNYDPWK